MRWIHACIILITLEPVAHPEALILPYSPNTLLILGIVGRQEAPASCRSCLQNCGRSKKAQAEGEWLLTPINIDKLSRLVTAATVNDVPKFSIVF